MKKKFFERIGDLFKKTPPMKKPERLVVVDTSFLLNLDPEKIITFLRDTKHGRIVIPSPAIGELANSQKKEEGETHLAYMKRMLNKTFISEGVQGETPDVKIVFDPSWAKNPDYWIVNVAVKLKNQGKEVFLLSNDFNQINKGLTYGIQPCYADFKKFCEPAERLPLKNSKPIPALSGPLAFNKSVKELDAAPISPDISPEDKFPQIDKFAGRPSMIVLSNVVTDWSWWVPFLNVENDSSITYIADSKNNGTKGWVVVISEKGNKKDCVKIDEEKYFPVNPNDQVCLFKPHQDSILFNLGKFENGKFVCINEELIRLVDGIHKYDVKYHTIIREAIKKCFPENRKAR